MACLLAVQLVAQHLVLDHEAGGTVTFHDDYTRIATELAAHGVRPPCLVQGVQYIPIALRRWLCVGRAPRRRARPLPCSSGPHGRPPSYARNWRAYRITGTTVLKVNAYIR